MASTVVFSGTIGRLPLGGRAWIEMNYLAGLAALGHDVYYLEECGEGSWVYHWDDEELTTDLAYPAGFVRRALDRIGLADRWIYRAGEESEGMDAGEFKEVCADADVLLIRAVPLAWWRPEYSLPRRRVFVDADPGFTQMKLANGHSELTETVRRCERLFTVGQRLGEPGCGVPTNGRRWERTVPPVHLPLWPVRPPVADGPFTSVLQWSGYGEVEFKGRRYGDKAGQFRPYLDLPRRCERPFRVAATGVDPGKLSRHGWEVLEGWRACASPDDYQDFIARSRAEFSVAKHGYVETRAGWFSDRSACYLASGRPVVVQDTGLDWLGDDGGMLRFSTPEQAVAAVESVDADYPRHATAARALAERVFAAERVLPALVEA
jgi:hypothetical protein